MKLPNRITTTAEAPPGEYQRSLYLSLNALEFVVDNALDPVYNYTNLAANISQ